MKILIDLTYIRQGSTAGVTIFAFRLLEGFKKCLFADIVLLATPENRGVIESQTLNFEIVEIKLKYISYAPYMFGTLNSKKLNKIITAKGVNIFFSPYISFSSLHSRLVPQIGVVHDAQGYKLKSNILKQLAHDFFTNKIISGLSHIVTISQFAKTDILKHVTNINCPISVVYNSIGLHDSQAIKKNINTVPYILNVNTMEPYKNLITLIKAFDLIKDKIPHSLIVKAKKLPYWDNEIYPFIKEHDLVDRVQLIESRYSDEQMSNLYINADLFVSPSLMEGFGFTPIEAALYNIPVISTKVSALYETTKGLLNYYDPPTDPLALSKVIMSIIHADKDGDKLQNISHTYSKVYSPQVQAQAYLKLFSEVL